MIRLGEKDLFKGNSVGCHPLNAEVCVTSLPTVLIVECPKMETGELYRRPTYLPELTEFPAIAYVITCLGVEEW